MDGVGFVKGSWERYNMAEETVDAIKVKCIIKLEVILRDFEIDVTVADIAETIKEAFDTWVDAEIGELFVKELSREKYQEKIPF